MTRRGAREAAVEIRMVDVPKTPKPRPARTRTREQDDEAAVARVARSSRITHQLLARLEQRRMAGELESEVWAGIREMLEQFIPTEAVARTHRPANPAPPASATRLQDLVDAVDRLSVGLETGRIYDRDLKTLSPALDRLAAAWIRRTSP